MVHDDADFNEEGDVKTIAFENFVNAAAFHFDGTGEPGNASALGFEFPFNHVTEVDCLIVHFVSKFE